MFVQRVSVGNSFPFKLGRDFHAIYRSDVHFWKHGRIGDSMVVTDEVRFLYHSTENLHMLANFSVDLAMSLPEKS